MDDIPAIPAKRRKAESDTLQNSSHSSNVSDCHQEESCKDDKSGQSSLKMLKHVFNSIPNQLLEIEAKYNQLFKYLVFEEPVAYVYNPTKYAYDVHSQFIQKFCQSKKEILFLGINPGPWGMSQTGVPFGDAVTVRDWFRITGEVHKPVPENVHRPVRGLSCPRIEAGGQKFWEILKDTFGKDPQICCENLYVHTYCPLAFLKENGRNITPPELKPEERDELFRICDNILLEILLLLEIKTIIAVGKFAEVQSRLVIRDANLNSMKLLSIPHPSSRNLRSRSTWKSESGKVIKRLLSQ